MERDDGQTHGSPQTITTIVMRATAFTIFYYVFDLTGNISAIFQSTTTMAPPPPTQAGRFKPRKPAKRIAPTSATPIAVPGAVTSSSEARTTAPGRGRGAGGGGRGGRGRGVLPQGQVFFTGTDKPAATSSRTSATAVAAASSKRKGKAAGMIISSSAVAGGPKPIKSVALEVQEEILTTHEEEEEVIVPDAAPRSAKVLSAATSEPKEASQYDYGDQSGDNAAPSDALAHYYDSDSADEEETMRDRRKESQLQPILVDSTRVSSNLTASSPPLSNEHASPHLVSPLSIPSTSSVLPNGKNSLLLVQLPTRLPPIISATRPDEVHKDSVVTEEEAVQVSTPAVELGAFDNQLTDAQPGRLGKILVYKSGRTVLVWESAPGEPVVYMNITEGLNCNFRQQAALIDMNENELTPLGTVQKTIVVTPELGDGYHG